MGPGDEHDTDSEPIVTDVSDFEDGADTVANEEKFVDEDGAKRRTQKRVEAPFRVTYQSVDELVVAFSTDISQGGMFITTDRLLPSGGVIRLQLELPNEGPVIGIIARVAYVRGPAEAHLKDLRAGMGVEFLHVDGGPIQRQLADYLTEQLDEAKLPDVAASADVLIVDDDTTYRDRIASAMITCGHKIRTATNGLDALGAALRDPPDLILSDVQMPTMDGWQFLRMVRSRQSLNGIPFVFLTTLGGDDERLKGYQLGVDDYIAKPFKDAELKARVSKVLSRARKRPRASAEKNALRGDLSQVGLPSILSFIEMERRSGALLLITEQQLATIHIRDGAPARVDLPEAHEALDGVNRLYFILDWTEGRFEFTPSSLPIADELNVTSSFALLEHARMSDEAAG